MNFISRIIKSINAMRERLKIERHEAMYGPHFNEECALKAVSKMENEDGSRGEHWSLEETTSIANQYGINLKGEKYNKYDWYVALNMIRSDYYRAVVTMTSSNLLTDNANKFNVIGAKIDAQTQMINDKFCQLEMREMQNKIDTLLDEKQGYQLSALTQQQTQNLVNQLRPCPVPAYLTCNPFGCNGGFTGYGYGYNDG